MTSRSKPAGLPAWQWAALIVLALPMIAYSAVGIAEALARMPHALADPAELFRISCGVVIAAFGALVLARGRLNRGAAHLGLILIALATQVAPGPAFDNTTVTAWGLAVLMMVVARSAAIGYLWPLFSLEISGGAVGRAQERIVHGLAILFALTPAVGVWIELEFQNRALAAAIWTGSIIGNQGVGYAILFANYRRNDAAGRNRIKIAFVAFVLFMFSSLSTLLVSYAGMPGAGPLNPAFALAATALLAYATLRHRLFDFGFVLNRTLVYAILSFILLLAFGLAEWAVEHLIPEAWHEGGPLISVAIALALFLSFHRLRDWVEKHVERLLFSKWHRNEATLRRFIAASDHFGSTAALEKAFADELSRFAGGAEAALYLRAGDGYALQAGKLAKAGKRYADDDRALALMRAERGPVNLAQAHSALPGALALPMLD